MKCSVYFGVVLGLLVAATGNPISDEPEKRLIQTSEKEPAKWLTYEEIFGLIDDGVTFMDITDHKKPAIRPISTNALPTTLRHQPVVRNAINFVETSRVEGFMVNLTSFYNRYYQSQWGVDSANWILTEAQDLIRSSGYGGSAVATAFSHNFRQPSIVATIYGSDPSLTNERVILGAHMDTVVSGLPNGTANNWQPGGDDNASGSGALFEAMRALLLSGFIPKRTVEFQWYAGEELGLLGSQAIANSYMSTGINVISMLNFDVVGYFRSGRDEVTMIGDFTNRGLNQLMHLAVAEYLNVPSLDWNCGYGCSDHASWNRVGVPATSPTEPVTSPNMHTIRDTLATVSYEQVAKFSKLAVAYAIEIAEPNN